MNIVKECRGFKFIHEKIRNMSIIPKLAIPYIISIALCAFIVSSFYYYEVRSEVEVRSRELAGNTIKQSKAAIEYRLEQYNNLVDMLYRNFSFQDLLFFEYYDDIEGTKAADKILSYLTPISGTVNDDIYPTIQSPSTKGSFKNLPG